jgi:hypothetical protein
MTLVDALPGRITQLAFRTGLKRKQVRGAVLTLIRQGRARWFRGRVVPVTKEIAVNTLPTEAEVRATSHPEELPGHLDGLLAAREAAEIAAIAYPDMVRDTERAPITEVSRAELRYKIERALDATSPATALMALVDAGHIEYEQASDAYYERFLPRHRRPLPDVVAEELTWGGRGYPGPRS